jgi:hypothetical protein
MVGVPYFHFKIAKVAFKNLINFNMCSNRELQRSQFSAVINTPDWCTIQSLLTIWHAYMYMYLCIECRAEVAGISLHLIILVHHNKIQDTRNCI